MSGMGNGNDGVWQYEETIDISSAVASIEFTGLSANAYKVMFINLLPETDGALISMTVSNDNGSSYASADYQWALGRMDPDTPEIVEAAGTTETIIRITQATAGNRIGAAAGEFGVCGYVDLYGTGDSSNPVMCMHELVYQNQSGNIAGVRGYGISADDDNGGSTLGVNAIKFTFTSGNIASGKVKLYRLDT